MEPEDLARICSNGSEMAWKERPACADVEILFVVFYAMIHFCKLKTKFKKNIGIEHHACISFVCLFVCLLFTFCFVFVFFIINFTFLYFLFI